MARKSNTKRGAVRIAAFAALVLLAACNERPTAPVATGPTVEGGAVVFPAGDPQLAVIAVAPAEEAGQLVVRLPGRLVWNEDATVRLFPAFAGKVVRIEAKPGDRVQAGQVLARLASPDFGEVQADARKAETDFAVAEKSLARVRSLVENGVAPQKELIEAEAQLARAQADRSRAQERVKLYGGGAGIDASFAIRSPIAGTVVERNINPGQELRPDMNSGSTPPMFVVTDPSRLWIMLDATERDLAMLKPGETVTFVTTAYGPEKFDARLDFVSDAIDPQTRTLRVRGAVPNADRRLKGEMFVTAKVHVPSRAAVAVPSKAVFLVGQKQYAFVEEGPGRFRRVEVETAGEQGTQIAVAKGLAAGQKVVVDGSLFLQHIYQKQGGR
jgi:cobalt-zinc-cadmium efflux system membrane fusion protein